MRGESGEGHVDAINRLQVQQDSVRGEGHVGAVDQDAMMIGRS